jgi:amidase
VPLGFFPNDTVPVWNGPETMWPVPGGPFGLSFIGTAWTEFDLIGFAYAYEQKTRTRLQRKAYAEAVPKTQLVNTMGKQTANAMCTTHVPVD